MSASNSLTLGLGIGWRPETAGLALIRPDLGFVEVITESVATAKDLPTGLHLLLERGVTVIPHGVALGLGGGQRPDPARLARTAALATRLNAPLVSEHVAFVRAGGLNAGHLMPLPRTREALDVLVANVRIAQDALPVPLGLEPVATLMEWSTDEMDEGQFLAELVDRTGCRLLLDLANLYSNSRNHGYDPLAMLDRLPLDAIAYVHVAGGVENDGLWHDTHAHALMPEVADLVTDLAARVVVPGMLLERDDAYPTVAELSSELDVIAERWGQGNDIRSERTQVWVSPRRTVAASREPSEKVRSELEASQRALLEALVAHGDVPLGFVEHRVAATGRSLRHKRLHETRDAAPALARCLGPRFAPLFEEWADAVPPLGGPRTDAQAFARSLPSDLLDRPATIELLAGELRRRNRLGVRVRRFGRDRRVTMVARLRGGREFVR